MSIFSEKIWPDYVNQSKCKMQGDDNVSVAPLAIGYLLNRPDSKRYSKQTIDEDTIDSSSHDRGPEVSPPRNSHPRKILPRELLEQMTQQDLEAYHAMNYSRQESLVANFLVRKSGFVIEKSQVWIEITRMNGGRAPTHIQVRRFLQFLERSGMKITRQAKRYRTNGIMFIDRNWLSIREYIGVLLQMPRETC